MSQTNPLTANFLHCDPADTAAQPSIAFGDCDGQKSGTGIHGDASSVKICVNGSDVATFNSGGLVGPSILAFSSTAGAGGAATEVMTVTGLLSTDTILSVSQKTPGANGLALIGFSTQANNHLTAIWHADPGAGSVILVAIKR